MVHSYLYWIDHWADEISIWSLAVNHYLWLHNRLPSCRTSITSIELLTSNKADHRDLSISHVW